MWAAGFIHLFFAVWYSILHLYPPCSLLITRNLTVSRTGQTISGGGEGTGAALTNAYRRARSALLRVLPLSVRCWMILTFSRLPSFSNVASTIPFEKAHPPRGGKNLDKNLSCKLCMYACSSWPFPWQNTGNWFAKVREKTSTTKIHFKHDTLFIAHPTSRYRQLSNRVQLWFKSENDRSAPIQ